ncbi:MAG: FAD-dependent thymidylate synthase [Candidatus Dormibacteraeota bacterium]|nr:FAD-dependent thymidylate synthase [Candidatus Dormibacteraeota bacterium]
MAGPYHVEAFTAEERSTLEPFVSDLEAPAFVLVNLPQVTAAALFARYSRSSKSVRRLLLDEFLATSDASRGVQSGAGQARASDLFGRVLAEYGDDSVAQLAGVHVACEQVSQLLAKLIEWGRLASYLEQSTRYIPFSDRRDGHYRYHRDAELLASEHARTYVTAMDGLFDAYCGMLEPLRAHLDATLPTEDDAAARRRAIRALSLDIMRGLLPAGTVSNVGVFASPQALEQLVMRLRASQLPEAQRYAEVVNAQLQRVIPEFLTRLDRTDRGVAWVEYLRDSAAAAQRDAAALPVEPSVDTQEVRLVTWTPDAEDRVLAASLFPDTTAPIELLLSRVQSLGDERKRELFEDVIGVRGNRRHRPGRGLEHAEYTFEIVSDYGAFRDLQRHRLLTIQWQRLTPALGYSVPGEVEDAGLGAGWRQAVALAEAAHDAVAGAFPEQAGYLVTLAHRIRYVVKLNAREAMHLIELRSSPQGHPSYRRIAREMHRQIDEVAGHHNIAGAMRFVGAADVHLPRYAAEAAGPV